MGAGDVLHTDWVGCVWQMEDSGGSGGLGCKGMSGLSMGM